MECINKYLIISWQVLGNTHSINVTLTSGLGQAVLMNISVELHLYSLNKARNAISSVLVILIFRVILENFTVLERHLCYSWHWHSKELTDRQTWLHIEAPSRSLNKNHYMKRKRTMNKSIASSTVSMYSQQIKLTSVLSH